MWKRLGAVFLVLGMTATPASAETVRLTTGNDYKPYTDESLPGGGLATQIVRAACEAVGHDLSVDFRPWKRGYNDTLENKYIGTFPYVKTEERLKEYAYSEPIFTAVRRPLVMADSDVQASDLDALKGMTFCEPAGYAIFGKLKPMLDAGEIERHEPQSMKSCLRLLQRGRVDFVPLGSVQGPATVADVLGTTETTRFLDIELAKTILYVMVPKDAPDAQARLAIFNKGLARIRENGTYDTIVAQVLGADS